MTPKQRIFCDEYLTLQNATQAAIRAGYSPKTARSIASNLLTKVDIQNYIKERLDELQSERVADAEEVMRYLTSVMRGESRSSEIVVEGQGDGISSARVIVKPPNEKDRLRAAELLGKRYSLYTDRINVEGDAQVTIIDDIPKGSEDDP